jgi:cytochrome c oxidase subunit II
VRMPLFRRAKRWLIPITGLLLSSILFAACGENYPSTILDTHGPVAEQETFLFWVVLVIAVIIFVGVEGMLIFNIIRFREKPGTPAPKQVHGNLTVEAIWTALPALVLLVVLVFTVRGVLAVAPESQPTTGRTIEVTAIGHQWWWEFYYPEYNITTADTLVIPTNTTIHVNLYSNNVIHSFWVPKLTGKTDLIPGHDNTKWFIANNTGIYQGICAEFCGTQHANMRFDVDARTTDAFNTWAITASQTSVTPADGSLAATGETVFKQQCATCHGIVGVTPKYQMQDSSKNCDEVKACLLGPDLTHFGSRHLIAGGVLSWNEQSCQPNDPDLLTKCAIAEWLHDTQGIKPGNDMVVNLTPDQINQLVAYLITLK